jgi:hypothetical protein
MRRTLRTLLAVLALALLPATSAHAQQGDPNGVQIDPNTPSGHEYDIPVQKARRQASGSSKKKSSSGAGTSSNGSSGGGGSDGSSGLFGAGVTSDHSSNGLSSSRGSSSTDDSQTTTGDTGTTSTPAATEGQGTTAAQPTTDARDPSGAAIAAADQGTGGPGPTVAFGVGGLVLLLAGLGGWLVKRRFA